MGENAPAAAQQEVLPSSESPADGEKNASTYNAATSKPMTAFWKQAQRVLAAPADVLPEVLQSLGGVIADFFERDGDNIEKHEVLAALAQVGVDKDAYPALERAVLAPPPSAGAAAAEQTDKRAGGGPSRGSTPAAKKNKKGGAQSRGGTPAKRGTTPAKKQSTKGDKGKGKQGSSSSSGANGKTAEEVVFSVHQFQRLVVLALQEALEGFRVAAVREMRPDTIISEDDVAKLRALTSPWEQVDQLARLLGESDHRANLRSGITVDFFAHHLLKCFEAQVDDLRTALFLTVMRQVLDATDEAGWPSPEASFEDFKRCFVPFCEKGAGGEYDPFTVEQARTLTAHVAETFFRFFSSFKYAFTQDRDKDQVTDAVFVEEPLAPRPLGEATAL
eukprot:INCI18422.1.p1 GENE.INCI18422.1~~INCI18422.1.p1  ORF type:complete len:390 (-),score=84.77 INCI18422.1:57-1226(-)